MVNPALRILFAFLALTFPVAAAEAAGGPISSADRTVEAGRTAIVTLQLDRAASCRAELTGKRATRSVSGPGWIRFSIKTRARARSGRYPVKVTCDDRTQSYELKVKGRENGTRKVAARIGGRSGLAPVPSVVPPTTPNTSDPNPGTTTDYDAMAENFYENYRSGVLGDGQCTDYAVQRREDVYRASMYPQIRRYVQYGGAQPDLPTYAYTWPRFAVAAGIRVDNVPRVGALVVGQPGAPMSATLSAGSLGHLGYVEGVNPDGSVVFSSMNWSGGPGVVVTDTMPAEYVSNPDVKFIG